VSDPAALKTFALFADLSEGERGEIAELLEERHLSPGETLFQEDDEADALALVVDGSVQLTSRRSAETAVFGGGSVLGGLALLAVGTRQATAIGAEPASVLLLRREDFLRLVEDSPRTACRIVTAIAADAASLTRLALDALGAASVDRPEAAD
jgi:CRP-like cAMP-binding protein